MSDPKPKPTASPSAGFVPLKSLSAKTPATPQETLAELRRIYFKTSRDTIEHDLAHAIELLKALPDEEWRDKAAVYMEGLGEMRAEWVRKERRDGRQKTGDRRPKKPR